MANPLVTEIVRARVKAALDAARSLAGVDHSLVKGRLRELVIDQLLRPVLPPSFGLGTGIIVDSIGGTSGEIDIVIFNREILMPLLFSERDGVFPVEACLYAIEVKSSLELRHLAETVDKFGKLKQLQKLTNANRFEPIGTLLAFGDRISNNRDEVLRHYDAIDCESPPLVRVCCIGDRGYWFFSSPENSWRVFDEDQDHSAIVRFLGGLANTITSNDWSPIRRGQLQRGNPLASVGFGHYIIPEGISRLVPRAICK
jgi:hypothetical protein